MRRRVLFLLAVLLAAACPVHAQTVEVAATTLTVGTSPTSPTDSSVRLANLATSGGTEVLLIDTGTLGVRRRALAKGDLPATVGYTDEAETWSLLQTFTSGLTSNGLLTIGGANDLLLGTGGLRAPSGSILLRNIADSANIATFGDSAIALGQPTTFTGLVTVGTAGVRATSSPLTLRNSTDAANLATFGDAAIALNQATTVNAALTVTGLTTTALIKTTGVYGVTSPFTVYATDATTPRLQVADGGPVLLTDTGTDSYLRVAATGASSGKRQWRAGNVNGNYVISAGNDAADTWSTLSQGTATAGVADGWFWGTAVSDVNPLLSYQTKLGTDIYKYLSLSAAELKVGTIVAQDYIATIGGRVLVLPTTQLTEDLGDGVGNTTITVEHNEMANGDRVLLEAAGKIEFLAIASGPTGTGGGDSVTLVGTATSAAATSVTLPAHSTGDLIVIIAFRVGSNTAPTASTGGSTITNLCNGGDNSTSYRVGYLTAAGSAETSGTWANATHMHAMVFQGVTAVSTCTTLSGTATTTLSYPAMTLADSDGSSYVVRAGLTNQTSSTSGAMTGYTLLKNETGSSRNSSTFLSSAGQTSVTQFDVTGLTSGNTRGIGIELQGTTTPATGPFQYTVTRDLDGTGRNLWYKGDAVANTGTTGDGFWDIYSIQSTKGGTEAGPTMCANVRTSSTYNAWSPFFCAGNLNGLYGNSATDLYGMAFGDYTDVWGQMDATNGLRFFMNSADQMVRLDPSGYLQLGSSGSGQANSYLDNTNLKLRRGTVDYVTLSSAGLTMSDGTNTRVTLDATNGLVLGRTTAGHGNTAIDTTGNLYLRSGTVNRIGLSASNGTFSIFDDDGTTARVQIGTTASYFGSTAGGRMQVNYTGSLQMYDETGTIYYSLDSTNGLLLGDWYTAGKGYFQVTKDYTLMCKVGGVCPVVFNSNTGDLSLTGAVSVGTNGYIRSGSTTFESGNGFFLGYSGAAHKFYIGSGTGTSDSYLSYDGTTTGLTIKGSDIYSGVARMNTAGGIGYFQSSSASIKVGTTNTGSSLTLGMLNGNEIIVDSFQIRPASSNNTALGSSTYKFGDLWLDLPDYVSGGTHTHNFVLVGKTDGSTGYAIGKNGTCASTTTLTVVNGLITACS